MLSEIIPLNTWFEENLPGSQSRMGTVDQPERFWTAPAACRGEAQRRLERSGDGAFGFGEWNENSGRFLPKRCRASLATAVQNLAVVRTVHGKFQTNQVRFTR